jgi:hypothetical protein
MLPLVRSMYTTLLYICKLGLGFCYHLSILLCKFLYGKGIYVYLYRACGRENIQLLQCEVQNHTAFLRPT